MATKTRRIEARIDPDTDDLVARAATVTRESVSAFLVRSARVEAMRVLGRVEVTWLPAGQFDLLIEALDEADPAPTLAAAADRRRAYTRA